MDDRILMHELAVFLLGAGTCALARTYLPLEEPVKKVLIFGIAGVTALRMAFVAGLL